MRAKHSPKWIAALAAAALLCGGLALFVWKTGLLDRIQNLEELQSYLRSFAPWTELVFFLLQISSVILAPIPSNMAAMAGGLCLGFVRGAIITFCAVTLGSFITFSLARVLGQGRLSRYADRKLPKKYRNLLHRKRDTFLTLAFLFPFFPDDLLCIVAGLTDIPTKRFVLIVLFTRHWGLLAASALGSSLLAVPHWALPLLALGCVVIFVLGLVYGDRVEAALLRRMGR